MTRSTELIYEFACHEGELLVDEHVAGIPRRRTKAALGFL